MKPSDPPAIDGLNEQKAAVVAATARLHGIVARTDPAQVATEVLRLNDAVRAGVQGRIIPGSHPEDYSRVAMNTRDTMPAGGKSATPGAAADAAANAVAATPADAGSTTPASVAAAHSATRSSPTTTLAQAAAMLQSGETTSEKLTQQAITRAEETQPTLNAFIAIWADRALEQARAFDRELASGRSRGPLHGIPLAHKDCFTRVGLPMSVGSKVFPDTPGDAHAAALQHLAAAGGGCRLVEHERDGVRPHWPESALGRLLQCDRSHAGGRRFVQRVRRSRGIGRRIRRAGLGHRRFHTPARLNERPVRNEDHLRPGIAARLLSARVDTGLYRPPHPHCNGLRAHAASHRRP
jgi:hypothetical protein